MHNAMVGEESREMNAELDRQEAAEALGLSAAAFRARAGDPSCPLGEGVKRGRKLYWSRDAVEATRIWEETRHKPAKDAPQQPANRNERADRATSAAATVSEPRLATAQEANSGRADTTSTQSQSARPSEGSQPNRADRLSRAIDPIGMWLDICKQAATFFQTSADPRRALLLMNPFAPFAAYASFAQPDFITGMVKQATAGLGVWGAPMGLGGASSAAPSVKRTQETPKAAAERARLEATKLYRCAEPRGLRS